METKAKATHRAAPALESLREAPARPRSKSGDSDALPAADVQKRFDATLQTMLDTPPAPKRGAKKP